MKKVFQNSDFRTWSILCLIALVLGFLTNEIQYGLIFAVKFWICSFVFSFLAIGQASDILNSNK